MVQERLAQQAGGGEAWILMVAWAKDVLPTPHQALIEAGLAREDASESGSQFTASERGTSSMGIDEAEEFFAMQAAGLGSPTTPATEVEAAPAAAQGFGPAPTVAAEDDKKALLNQQEAATGQPHQISPEEQAPTLAALGLVGA